MLFSISGWTEIVASILAAVSSGMLTWDPSKLHLSPLLDRPASWLAARSPFLVIVFTVLTGIGAIAHRKITPPRRLEVIHWLLDELQARTFRDEIERGDPLHEHRVTLFKLRRLPFRGRWLVPFKRSGRITLKTETRFRAGDDPGRLEGVAGQTFSCGTRVIVEDLPDVKASSSQPAVQERLLDEYAQKTFVSSKWVRERLRNGKQFARSYYGLHVEGKGGATWGVLVVDSMNPKAKAGAEEERTYRFATALLTKVLEEM